MKKSVKRLLVILMAVIIAFSNLAVCFAADTYKINVPVKYCQTEARSMLAMINSLRSSKDAWYWNSSDTQKVYPSGLKAYKYDYNLEKIAMQRAAEIAISFTHERPDGTKWTSAFSGYTRTAENLAAGPKSATAAFEKWLESANKYANQGHRRNMLGTYTAIGIAGVYYNGAYYWVQEYGDKCVNSTSTTANDKDASVPVNILPSKITSKTLSLSTSSISVNIGSTASVPTINGKINVKDAWKTDNPITVSATWTPSDTSIVTVSSGKLNPQAAGSTTIKATAMGQSFSANVTVKGGGGSTAKTYKATFNANGGSVTPTSASAKAGGSVTLPKATRKSYTFLGWATSKSATAAQYKAGASITLNGNITLYAVWRKTSNPPKVFSVSIPEKASVNYKSSTKLVPDLDVDDGAKYTVTWKSADSKIASVSKDGTVTGTKKFGKATTKITCTVTDSKGKTFTDTCNVTAGFTWWQWIIGTVLFGFIWY